MTTIRTSPTPIKRSSVAVEAEPAAEEEMFVSIEVEKELLTVVPVELLEVSTATAVGVGREVVPH